MFLEYLIETGIEIHLNLNLCVWQGRDFLNTNSINAMVIVLFGVLVLVKPILLVVFF